MNKISFFLLFVFLFAGNLSLCLANNDTLPENVLHNLKQHKEYKNIILTLPDEQYLQRSQRYIALDPDTKNVSITAQEIQFVEEAESFARHRRHYMAFWSLFSFMFVVDILWAE